MNKGFAHIFLLTGAIFVLLGGAWLLKNKKSNTTIESPISSTSPDIYTNENPDNWKTFTYENEKLSFHLKHPQEWIAMTLADNPYDPCVTDNFNNNVIVFSKKYLQECGFVGDQYPNAHAEMAIHITNPYKNIYTYLSPPVENTMVAHQEAAMYRYSYQQALPNINSTRIYFNYKDVGFEIFLKNTTEDGSQYDPIYDQVLSTFELIEK